MSSIMVSRRQARHAGYDGVRRAITPCQERHGRIAVMPLTEADDCGNLSRLTYIKQSVRSHPVRFPFEAFPWMDCSEQVFISEVNPNFLRQKLLTESSIIEVAGNRMGNEICRTGKRRIVQVGLNHR